MSKKGENITKRKDGRWEARILKGYGEDGRVIYKSLYANSYSQVKAKKTEYLLTFTKEKTKNTINLIHSIISYLYFYNIKSIKSKNLHLLVIIIL